MVVHRSRYLQSPLTVPNYLPFNRAASCHMFETPLTLDQVQLNVSLPKIRRYAGRYVNEHQYFYCLPGLFPGYFTTLPPTERTRQWEGSHPRALRGSLHTT